MARSSLALSPRLAHFQEHLVTLIFQLGLVCLSGTSTRIIAANVTTTTRTSTTPGLDLEIKMPKEVWFKVFTRHEIYCIAYLRSLNTSMAFSWFLNNSGINENQNDTSNKITVVSVNNTSSKIVFANVSRDQSGYYRCQVTMDQLRKNAVVKVNVGDIPSPLKLSYTCDYNSITGTQFTFSFTSMEEKANTATYAVSFCKSTTSNKWCTNSDMGWMKVKTCSTTTSNQTYFIKCQFSSSMIHPLSSNTHRIRVEARNNYGIRKNRPINFTPAFHILQCVDIKPKLSVKKPINQQSSHLTVTWWLDNRAKMVFSKTVMSYSKTGSKNLEKSFEKINFCDESTENCQKTLNDLSPCTSYTICVKHITTGVQAVTSCSTNITSNNYIPKLENVMNRANDVKTRTEYTWKDEYANRKGPYYYNYTLQKNLEGKILQETGRVPYETTSVFFKYEKPGTKCKLEVKKCTDCGCGKSVSRDWVLCGAKQKTTISPGQEDAKGISDESITIAVLVGTLGGIILVVGTLYVMRRKYKQRGKADECVDIEDVPSALNLDGPDDGWLSCNKERIPGERPADGIVTPRGYPNGQEGLRFDQNDERRFDTMIQT